MSVNDPQHMPPKCCTSEHIPLKHVERLFDTSFKILWNKKFQEYTTKNRMYCPARRCGEWIKPGNIYVEGGKRYGKCSRCKTKVCGRCNGKWHGSKDCPKDDATNALLEAAKKAGWQRCFNCRSMVELKEGCNHMTCRCTAEFCMICGLKWKTCDCPWFNYEAVETNRLHHMRIPGRPRARHDDDDDDDDDEPHARQRHDPVDDDLARRLHAVQVREDDEVEVEVEDYHGRNGPPNTHHHHVYRRPVPLAHAAANYAVRVDPARLPPARRSPPPVARRPPPSRISETPILRRPAPPPTPALRPSVLAGLEGPRRGGRVSAWRAYVTPTAPAEGVLSM
ncbi:MAG: hypothetical protein M1818_000463 [Claussenomyces sp. TS43310]|nr:MAG: hypothetical protein M1818_000463 [Claussenomyces sp. TS43310]